MPNKCTTMSLNTLKQTVRGMRNSCRILVRKPEGKRPCEDLGVDGRIMLELILGKQGRKMWTGCTEFRIVISGGFL